MQKSPVLVASLAAASLVLAGCGSDTWDGSGADDNGVTSVVASFYPYAWVAEEVGGDHVAVQSLTSPGVEPHDLELAPKQVVAVQSADLVIFQHEFQAAVDDAVEQADRKAGATVDVADLVEEMESTGEEEAEHGHEEGEEHAEEGEEHAEEGEEHAEEGGEHDHGGHDPHVWLDPLNMVTVADAVAATLSKLDPDYATDYAANAKALEAKLKALDSEFSEGLETCKRRTVVTSHAAFAYLAERYNLTQEPIAGLDPANEPSPGQLADLTRLVRAEGITTIFTEELVSPAVAETVARETGAKTAVLSPIEGLTDETSDETYLSLQRQNLKALRQANDCS